MRIGNRKLLLDGGACASRLSTLVILSLTAPLTAEHVPVLDPNASHFPDSSLVDFSFALDAPAGKHGFLETTPKGHFRFQDGTPARFFGINVAKGSIFQPKDTIDRIVALFARTGLNLVRFHHMDESEGLIDLTRDDSQTLLEDRLELLDYWIYRLKEHGIYVWVDLLSYRRFKEGDGVANAAALERAAKPCAVFNPRLIELQQQYARKLLVEHVNRFTGLSYAADPAVALIELYDENGLFQRRNSWRRLPEPYQSELDLLWNDWLRRKYLTTEGLRQAWTNDRGECSLKTGESLETGIVELPVMELGSLNDSPFANSARSPARKNDGALFAHEVHCRYLRTMRDFLRAAGVRVPITAIGSSAEMPDLKAVADCLDFTGVNHYWDHPFWPSGSDWKLPSFFLNQNPIAESGEMAFAPSVAMARVRNKPLAIREWSYCWPNDFRSAGMVEAAAYGCLQDVDAMILFSYDTHPDNASISYFDVHKDVARWGLMALAARCFLTRAVSPARHLTQIAYSPIDAFYYYDYRHPIYCLAWVSRLANVFFDRTLSESADLTISSGRSGTGQYQVKPAVLFSNNKSRDLQARFRPRVAEWVEAYRVDLVEASPVLLSFGGLLLDANTTAVVKLWPGFSLPSVRAKGLTPIGVSEDGGSCYGFLNEAGGHAVFNTLRSDLALRSALDVMGKFWGGGVSHAAAATRRFSADTGETTRLTAEGRLVVQAPTFQALAGSLPSGEPLVAGDLRATLNASSGALVAVAVDGKSLSLSERYAVKFVTTANNSEVDTILDGSYNRGRRYVLRSQGAGPVLTTGVPFDKPAEVSVGSGFALRVYVAGGAFEWVRDGATIYFWCDTPGARFQVQCDKQVKEMEACDRQGQWRTLGPTHSATFPEGAALVKVRLG